MINRSHLTVKIRSKFTDQREEVLILSPDEYFEPLDDWEACFECDSTPRHGRLAEYVNVNSAALEYVEVELSDSSKRRRHIRREVFWNHNWLSFATDIEHESETSTEVIIELGESQSGCSQLVKFNKDDGGIRLVMHLLLRTLPSGEIESESLLQNGVNDHS